jgi:hypothetical protein
MPDSTIWPDVVQAVAAVVVAAFTAVLTWVGVLQARLLKRSTAMSRTALYAAKDSAAAAIRAAEIAEANLVALVRARIHMDKPSTVYFQTVPSNKHVMGVVGVVWRNAGPTAAVDGRQAVRMRYDFTPPTLQDAVFDEDSLGACFIGPMSTTNSGQFQISKGQFERVKNGEAFVHIFGEFRYRDGLAGTPERVSRFGLALEAGIPKKDGPADPFSFVVMGEFTSST